MSKANIVWRENRVIFNIATDRLRLYIPIVDHKNRMVVDNIIIHLLNDCLKNIFDISLSFNWFYKEFSEYQPAIPSLKIIGDKYEFKFVPESILVKRLFLQDSEESIDSLISFMELCNFWKKHFALYTGVLFACNLLEVHQKILTGDFYFTLDHLGYPVFHSQNFSYGLNVDPRDIILLLSSPEISFEKIWALLPHGQWVDEFKPYLQWISKDKPDAWILTALI